jgi:uncharacterized repeat protein (TIGR01451 family)
MMTPRLQPGRPPSLRGVPGASPSHGHHPSGQKAAGGYPRLLLGARAFCGWTLLLLLGWGSAAPARAEGGIISTPRTGPIGVWSGETLTIENGGSVTSTGTAFGVIVQTGGTLNITGGSVSAETNAVNLWDGTLNMTSGSVSSSQEAAVEGGSGSTATISGGSVSGHYDGVIVYGTATISGGSVSAETGVYVHAGGTATISGGLVSSATIVDNSTLSITGGSVTSGVGLWRATSVLSITGGSVTGGLSNNFGGSVTVYGSQQTPGCSLLVAGGVLTGTLLDGLPINTPVSGPITLVVPSAAPPTITLNGANPFTVDCHSSYSDPGMMAVDACGGGVNVNASGSVNVNTPGSYTITYTAEDGSGNTATKTRAVNVVDTTAPVVTPPASITQAADPGQCSAQVTVGTATATDTCAGSLTPTGTRSDSKALNAPYPVGTTTITWIATDPANNPGTAVQTVTVNDTEKPTIACPANITVPATSASGALVSYPTPSASDNCGSPTVSSNPPSGSTFPIDTTTVTCKAIDAAGNPSTCTFTVTVMPVADLSVAPIAPPSTVVTGSNLTYTLAVLNAGPQDAQSVALTDPLPAGTSFFSATATAGTLTTPKKGSGGTVTWSMGTGTLGGGNSVTLTLVVKVSAKAGAMLTNTASVSSSSPKDPNLANNSAITPTAVVAKH